MAFSKLLPPGNDLGPCEDECAHLDCKETREMAKTKCAYCKKPIGYDVMFVERTEDTALAHADCAMKASGL